MPRKCQSAFVKYNYFAPALNCVATSEHGWVMASWETGFLKSHNPCFGAHSLTDSCLVWWFWFYCNILSCTILVIFNLNLNFISMFLVSCAHAELLTLCQSFTENCSVSNSFYFFNDMNWLKSILLYRGLWTEHPKPNPTHKLFELCHM